MKRKKEWLALIVTAALLIAALTMVTNALTPKNRDYGSIWGQFLKEERDSIDVMFFGSSLVYCDVVPAVFWEHSGLSAYVNAGSEQPLPITLSYVQESLKTQSPRAIFVECSGLCFKKNPTHIKTNICQMPWGLPRLTATFRTAAPEDLTGLLFPLNFYHDRWCTRTEEDRAPYEADPMAGYTWLGESNGESPADSECVPVTEENWAEYSPYLEKIYALCQKKGIALVLYRAPAMRLSDSDWQQVTDAYADRAGVYTLDCWAHTAEIGANAPADYYDSLHYNAAGAEKFSAFLARWTRETLPLQPDPACDTALWQARADEFHSRSLTN